MRWKSLRARTDESGNAAIEFAIISPVVMLMTIGLMEMGMMMFTTSILEGATSMGSRAGMTGWSPDGSTRNGHIRDVIMQRSGGFLDPGRLTIQLLTYNNWNAVGEPEPCNVAVCTQNSPPGDYVDVNNNGQWDVNQGAPSAGGPNSVVLYTVRYEWPLVTPLVKHYFGNNGTVNLEAVAVVQNENF